MKRNRYTPALSALLIGSLLASFSIDALAQQPAGTGSPPRPAPRSNRQWVANNKQAWANLNSDGGICSGATVSNACAQASIVLASSVCGGSARFFQRANTTWQIVNLTLILASAAFTAVGASTTIANAKLFATLGGTTGLGAVTTTINANASGDSAGITSVNTTLSNFLIFLKTGTVPGALPPQANNPPPPANPQTPGDPPPANPPANQQNAGNSPPDNATIYKFAPVFAAQCEAAAVGLGK